MQQRTPYFLNIFLLSLFILIACGHKNNKQLHIQISTRKGDIELELYPDKAPRTVAAFLSFVDSGLFRNSSFYRVLKSEDQPSSAFKTDLIQGGIWQTNNSKALSLRGIPHENTQQTRLSHKNGVISLARILPGTASSEFFICLGDQPSYDYGGDANPDKQGFAAFGKVIKGMEIVRLIHEQADFNGTLTPPIEIINIKRLK